MFDAGSPALKVMISSPTQVPAVYATVLKLVAKAQYLESGVSCKAICADSNTADSWEAFIQTIGVIHTRIGNAVIFSVAAENIGDLTLPAVAFRRTVTVG